MPSLPIAASVALAGALGLLIGRFLNVLILRLPERLAHLWRTDARDLLALTPMDEVSPPRLVRKPWHCFRCQHTLTPWEMIPLLSWLLLHGRCRYCQAPISIQYPLVEALCALLSAAVIWRFGPAPAGLAALLFTWCLLALAGIDARTQWLPDAITQPLLWLGLLLGLKAVCVPLHAAVLGTAVGYLSLGSMRGLFKLATGKEGMGQGDVKLLAALGAWMGPWAILPILLLASLSGALIGGLMIALRRRTAATPLPFGPFIAAAGWVWLLAGPYLLDG